MTAEAKTGKEYGINPAIASGYCLLNGYAKQAAEPIVFVRYNHEHPFTSRITYPRSSDMCTIFIFLTGKFGFLVDDVIYDPAYGDVMLFRNFEKFTSVFYSNSYVDYYQINLPQAFFDAVNLPEFFHRQPSEKKSNMLVPDRRSRERILERLREIENLIQSQSAQTELLAYGNILQILGLLAAQSGRSEVPVTRIPPKLKQAVDYIHSNYTTLSGLEEVASLCGITNTYLSRLFQKSFQCTPNEYLNRLRISEAKYLLSTGSSLTDACYRSGFNNYTYFISKFKSLTGMTPAKFKSKT